MSEPVDDAALFRRVQEGDHQALEEIVRRYEGKLFNFALRLTGDREIAQDVVQDSFVRVLERAASFDPSRPFSPWIFRIAYHLIIDGFRARRAWPRQGEPPSGGAGLREAAPLTVPWVEKGAPEAIAPDQEIAVRRALGALPVQERALVILKHFHRLTYREIGESMGVPEGTVKSRLHTAIQHLREQLDAPSSGTGTRG